MNLLVLADTLSGGLGELAVAHARWFGNADWKVCLAAPLEPSTWHMEHVKVESVEIPSSIRDLPALWRASVKLRKIVEEVRPDIVHCHGIRSLITARLTTGSWHAVTLHGSFTFPDEGRWVHLARQGVLRALPLRAPLAVSVTPQASAAGWKFLPHASPRLSTISLAKSQAGEREVVRFLWLGRLDRPKVPEMFVEAMAVLSKRTSRRIAGIVAGAGPLLQGLGELARRLEAPIEFWGHVDDINGLFRQVDAVVLTSNSEGVPLAIEEAMWAGLPVVVSPLPGLAWLVGTAGLFAESVGDLARALEKLLDAELMTNAGAEAARQVRRQIGLDAPWPDLMAIYQEMRIGKKRGPSQD